MIDASIHSTVPLIVVTLMPMATGPSVVCTLIDEAMKLDKVQTGVLASLAAEKAARREARRQARDAAIRALEQAVSHQLRSSKIL